MIIFTIILVLLALYAVFFVCAVAIGIIFAVKAVKESRKINDTPVVTEEAIVEKKKLNFLAYEALDGDSLIMGVLFMVVFSVVMLPFRREYSITFRTNNNVRVKRVFEEKEAKNLKIGDRGMLTHKATQYKNFDKMM